MKSKSFAFCVTCSTLKEEQKERCDTEHLWRGSREESWCTALGLMMPASGAATWALTQRERFLQRCDRRMLRKMCGLPLTDWVPNTDILRRCGFEDFLLTVRWSRMSWFGHTYRRQDNDPLSRINQVEEPDRRYRGKPNKTWKECVNKDMAAADCAVWKTVIILKCEIAIHFDTCIYQLTRNHRHLHLREQQVTSPRVRLCMKRTGIASTARVRACVRTLALSHPMYLSTTHVYGAYMHQLHLYVRA